MTSTMKEAVIKAFNEAIQRYAEKGGKVYPGDVVVDYFPENARVANFTYRHPGTYLVPVELREGSGFIFLGGKVQQGFISPYLAWEEDNTMHSWTETVKSLEDHEQKLDTARALKELLTELMNCW